MAVEGEKDGSFYDSAPQVLAALLRAMLIAAAILEAMDPENRAATKAAIIAQDNGRRRGSRRPSCFSFG